MRGFLQPVRYIQYIIRRFLFLRTQVKIILWLGCLSAMLIIIANCSTTRQVRTLPAGSHKMDVSLGGPLFSNFGFIMPTPILSLSYQYGWHDKFTIGGSAYLTPVFLGFGYFEVNTATELFKQTANHSPWSWLPSATLIFNLPFTTDFYSSIEFFPELGTILSWRFGAPNGDFSQIFYLGATGYFNFYGITLSTPSLFLPALLVGHSFRFSDLHLNVEVKWQHFNQVNRYKAIRYVGIDELGALAIYLSLSYQLGSG